MIMWTLPRAGAGGACREDLVWKFSDYGSQIVGHEVSLVGLTSILIFLKWVRIEFKNSKCIKRNKEEC